MTNYINARAQTNIDTEYQNMMIHLEAAQSKLLAKYGMTSTDIPALMRKLMSSLDGSLPEMSHKDEKRFLIYSGMLETKKYVEAFEELIQAKKEINSLHDEIDGLHRHIDMLYETGQFDDEEDADDVQEHGVDAPANDNRQGLYPVT